MRPLLIILESHNRLLMSDSVCCHSLVLRGSNGQKRDTLSINELAGADFIQP